MQNGFASACLHRNLIGAIVRGRPEHPATAYSQLAGFLGANLPMDGSLFTGSYTILTPTAVAWNAADNGVYTVTLRPGEEEDTFGNGNPATTLGTFTVTTTSASPGTMASLFR